MEIADFTEIEAEFIQRVHTIVWCNAATIDRHQRPRSRILHPIWEGSTGWVCTNRNSHKSKHLTHNPYISLAYINDPFKPVYADCLTEWVEDLETKQRIWDLFKHTPEPLGFDPAHDFISPDHEKFGLLRLIPWRIAVVTFPAESHYAGERIWRSQEGCAAHNLS
jgi:uncharacterized pyridoxamine 5'-phosphate oxidase family protein